jgi:hypothetical protein
LDAYSSERRRPDSHFSYPRIVTSFEVLSVYTGTLAGTVEAGSRLSLRGSLDDGGNKPRARELAETTVLWRAELVRLTRGEKKESKKPSPLLLLLALLLL